MADSPSEDYLAFLEGSSQYVAMLTHVRELLVDKGWTVPGAETAAIQMTLIAAASPTR